MEVGVVELSKEVRDVLDNDIVEEGKRVVSYINTCSRSHM